MSLLCQLYLQFFICYSYVYDPMLTKFPERKHHIFLTTICFVFVYVWHGLAMNILIWSVCNFIGILLETLGSDIATAKLYQDFEVRYHTSKRSYLDYFSGQKGSLYWLFIICYFKKKKKFEIFRVN